MPRFGCLGILLFVALLCVEFYVLLVVMGWMNDILGPILLLIALSIVGVKVLQFHLKRLAPSFVAGRIGNRLIGMVGAVLLIIPGFITAIIGLLLQLPPLQALFSRFGMMLAASLAKRAMGGGLGKGFPGFPGGGFPGGAFPGGGFPGGGLPPGLFPPGGFPGLKPDERIGGVKPAPKTYDVKPDTE